MERCATNEKKEKKREETHGNHQLRFRSILWKLAVLSSTYTHSERGTGRGGERERTSRNRPMKRYTCLQFVLLIYTRWNEPVTFTRQTQRDSMLRRSVSDSLSLSLSASDNPARHCVFALQLFNHGVGKIGSSHECCSWVEDCLETGILNIWSERLNGKRCRINI